MSQQQPGETPPRTQHSILKENTSRNSNQHLMQQMKVDEHIVFSPAGNITEASKQQ
jgi:hypothetical protein